MTRASYRQWISSMGAWLICLWVVGCGGGGSGGGDQGQTILPPSHQSPAPPAVSDQALTDMMDATEALTFAIERTLPVILAGSPKASASCLSSGGATAQGTARLPTPTVRTVDATLTFVDCDGFHGSLAMVGQALGAGEQVGLQLTLTGGLSRDCELTTAQLHHATTLRVTEQVLDGIATGTLTVSCASQGVQCV